MATRKMGTRIYDTEESNANFSRGASTVWINKSYRDPKGRKEGRNFAHGGEMQGSPVQPQHRQHQIPPRAMDLTAPMGPHHRPSPRGFRMTRSPKLLVGRAARPLRAPVENSGRARTIIRNDGQRDDGDGVSEGRHRHLPMQPEVAAHSSEVAFGGDEEYGNAETRVGKLEPIDGRRRRLILEDLEDDFEPPVLGKKEPKELAACEGKKKGRKLVKAGAVKQTAGTSPDKAKPRQARKKKEWSMLRTEEEVIGDKDSLPIRLGKQKGGRKAREIPSAPLDENSEVDGPLGDKGKSAAQDQQVEESNLSDESLSEEDKLRFVIKTRRLPSDQEQLTQPGQVQQVVAAFEEGLVLNEAKDSLEAAEGDKTLMLNEYGSNIEGGSPKRSIQALEGMSVDSPTPKRQFVEDQIGTEDAELVEEASQEWPQSDK
ncbi:unnamed protein product [Linum trigynum]|uniref:Uncharacterized protein n=1 Tax=Linum trigynum TaxID=586398 RepID=A0AAV2D8D3_9ROSI